jgi:hypothetical protein
MTLRTNVCLSIAIAAGFGLALASAPRAKIDDPKEAAFCGGQRYAISGFSDGSPPYLRLSADGVQGRFLIDYGATRSSLSADAFAAPAGSVRRATISLPGFAVGDFELRRYEAGKGQLGVIGADFLSLLTAEFTGSAVYLGGEPCPSDALRARGLVPIAQDGFFSSDPSTIKRGLPNVPVVFMMLGGVRAWAQIDTGYADSVYPHSADINKAFYDRLVESGLKLERLADIGVATCEGHESRPVYAIEGGALTIENEHGRPIAQTSSFHLVVKPANGCGGIGSMSAPAAQLGASFLQIFGTAVFDPKSGVVWLGTPGRQSTIGGG